MASASVQISTGTTIAFGTSAFAANITGYKPPSSSRASLDTSHMGTTGPRTFIPGDLYDNGELNITIQFNPDTDPPIDGQPETITITYPSGATWVVTGFMTNYEPSDMPLEELLAASCTIKVTGAITITTGTTSTTAGS